MGSRAGWFGSAQGGTLHMDEIADLRRLLQSPGAAKQVRALFAEAYEEDRLQDELALRNPKVLPHDT